jgi:DNA-binding GntR family transcriptional regulator
MPRQAAISRSVLSDQVKDRLLEAILDGRYPPGARIVETRVARELGTSQAPVREALRDLEALGVVETSPFRGARVRRPSADELLEAFTVRSQLESLAARLALERITDDELDELSLYLDEMRRAARAGDSHAEATADASFHGRVVEIAGNATERSGASSSRSRGRTSRSSLPASIGTLSPTCTSRCSTLRAATRKPSRHSSAITRCRAMLARHGLSRRTCTHTPTSSSRQAAGPSAPPSTPPRSCLPDAGRMTIPRERTP